MTFAPFLFGSMAWEPFCPAQDDQANALQARLNLLQPGTMMDSTPGCGERNVTASDPSSQSRYSNQNQEQDCQRLDACEVTARGRSNTALWDRHFSGSPSQLVSVPSMPVSVSPDQALEAFHSTEDGYLNSHHLNTLASSSTPLYTSPILHQTTQAPVTSMPSYPSLLHLPSSESQPSTHPTGQSLHFDSPDHHSHTLSSSMPQQDACTTSLSSLPIKPTSADYAAQEDIHLHLFNSPHQSFSSKLSQSHPSLSSSLSDIPLGTSSEAVAPRVIHASRSRSPTLQNISDAFNLSSYFTDPEDLARPSSGGSVASSIRSELSNLSYQPSSSPNLDCLSLDHGSQQTNDIASRLSSASLSSLSYQQETFPTGSHSSPGTLSDGHSRHSSISSNPSDSFRNTFSIAELFSTPIRFDSFCSEAQPFESLSTTAHRNDQSDASNCFGIPSHYSPKPSTSPNLQDSYQNSPPIYRYPNLIPELNFPDMPAPKVYAVKPPTLSIATNLPGPEYLHPNHALLRSTTARTTPKRQRSRSEGDLMRKLLVHAQSGTTDIRQMLQDDAGVQHMAAVALSPKTPVEFHAENHYQLPLAHLTVSEDCPSNTNILLSPSILLGDRNQGILQPINASFNTSDISDSAPAGRRRAVSAARVPQGGFAVFSDSDITPNESRSFGKDHPDAHPASLNSRKPETAGHMPRVEFPGQLAPSAPSQSTSSIVGVPNLTPRFWVPAYEDMDLDEPTNNTVPSVTSAPPQPASTEAQYIPFQSSATYFPALPPSPQVEMYFPSAERKPSSPPLTHELDSQSFIPFRPGSERDHIFDGNGLASFYPALTNRSPQLDFSASSSVTTFNSTEPYMHRPVPGTNANPHNHAKSTQHEWSGGSSSSPMAQIGLDKIYGDTTPHQRHQGTSSHPIAKIAAPHITNLSTEPLESGPVPSCGTAEGRQHGPTHANIASASGNNGGRSRRMVAGTWKCPDCGATFTRNDRLKYHIESKHLHLQPEFFCSVPGCTKAFRQRSDLVRHLRHVHRDQSGLENASAHDFSVTRGEQEYNRHAPPSRSPPSRASQRKHTRNR